ncbi:heavy metal translocating P-type ATPase [Coleofasciculus sp. FACHB-SPT9]|uniref:heavy metal translocating P-type ATPase n=1 Tax=Cyanophyceae TaxID=3028117 RepID=UPI00168766B7|nr:heavy metal translocating P-type ATPase [Coleofasciculus sp. FACHB-SPT9]MBD1888023.1 copper-translocating P-type ATPase [Coleofasciculus sp. FACHB-SPT9]
MQSPETVVASPASPVETIALDVTGMKCAGCVKAVEKQLTQHPGVVSARVNLVTEVAVVECEAGAIDPVALAEQVTEAGFPTQPRLGTNAGEKAKETLSPAERHALENRQQLRQLFIAGVLILLSGIGHLNQHFISFPAYFSPLTNIWFHWGLATAALLFPGRQILVDGWRGLRRNAPNMNTLVALGTLTAYTASCVALLFPQLGWECFFDEPVMLLGFILLGRTLEQRARGRAAAAFQALLALQPKVARLIANPTAAGSTPTGSAKGSDFGGIEIPVEQVRVGEWLRVLPGEQIPVDAEVVAGQTTVNESMLTGEPVPVMKQAGDSVAAGTLNQSGAIAIKATRTGKDTTLAQIVALVEEAQIRKAPVQLLADTVAGYFTYGVLAAATLTFLFWYFIGSQLWPDVTMLSAVGIESHSAMHAVMHHASGMGGETPPLQHSALLLSLKLAISVSVIACPCALGLATPTAILVGTGLGAERGLLIKGGDVLERVHHLDIVVFDKTGTLTTGHPIVTDCLPMGNFIPEILLQLAAAAESGTTHPLAEAIGEEAHRQELTIPLAEEFYTEPGLGVSALVEGVRVLLGNADWLTQQGISLSDSEQNQAQQLASAGKTVVYVAADGQLAGLIGVTDTLRPDAKATVSRLRQMGLRVMLLTGDRLEAARAIASQLELNPDSDVLADVRPDAKAAAIAQLQAQGQHVAMVGDGINDAPALAQADVGISLQGGTDVAIETAQIVLMRDRLLDVVKSIQLSRATFNKIRQNLFWAFAYNTISLPVAAGVLLPTFGLVLSPSAAGALMAFSSVSVVTNSLLLRKSLSTDN